MNQKKLNEKKYWVHQKKLRLIVWAALMVTSFGHAAPILLSTQPQSAGGKQPAPNIFLTVDDSGSMSFSPYYDDYPPAGQQNRMFYLQQALKNIFLNPGVIPENSIRLGFQAIHQCRGFGPAASKPTGSPNCPENRLMRFSGAHRQGFSTWVNNLIPLWGGPTPTHGSIYYVDDYMKNASGIWDPFLAKPGDSNLGEILSCRRTYHILMTDGAWNYNSPGINEALPGNADGKPLLLPDGVLFDPYGSTQPQTNIYRDDYEPQVTAGIPGLHSGTLKATQSDWAFMMWATDYSAIPNNVKSIIKRTTSESYGAIAVNPYWNPRNNPMTWQGISTYTIGFGPVTNFENNRPQWGGETLSGQDVNNLFNGSIKWSNPLDSSITDYEGPKNIPRRQELWHMAINGRGEFLPASNETTLQMAFKTVINEIFRDDTSYVSRAISNTQTIRSSSLAFVASFNPANWSGDLLAYPIMGTGVLDSTPIWSASQRLENISPENRRIYTFDSEKNKAVHFEWSKLNSSQKEYFKATQDESVGVDRVGFLRGDRSQEGLLFRKRNNLLGDIVNSSPWAVSTPNMGYTDDSYISFRKANINRQEMVYVGANDGMLHGFSMNGNERFSYIPRGAFTGDQNGIISLTNPSYVHRYFVDGSPFSGDYQISSGGSWKTVLVGSMGLGGRGFFAIDITNPGSWASLDPDDALDNILFDKTDNFTPSDSVGLLPAAQWEDIGYIVTPAAKATGNPNRITQITKLNNGRWAILLGNGVNSATEKASLLIQFLDHGRELVKIEADSVVDGANGLSTPTAIDLDGNRTTDVVYAGDLKGQLWKFDLSDTSPSRWKVSFNGKPIFVARSATNVVQPITTAPTYVNNGSGGLNLVFGTGRNLTPNDPSSTENQTIYSVWDNSKVTINRNADGSIIEMKLIDGTIIGCGSGTDCRSELLQRKVENVISSPSRGSFATTDSAVSVNYTGAGTNQRGWFFDLPSTGERVLENSTIVLKSLVYIPSVQPTKNSATEEETCDYKVKSAHYGLFLDAITGLPYIQRPLFDTNGDGLLDSNDITKASRIYVGADPVMLLNTKGKLGEQRFMLVPTKPGSSTSDLKCNTDNCGGYEKAGGASGQLQFGILNNSVGIGWRQLQ